MKIQTKKFIIHDAGDPTTGYYPATWKLKGFFSFEDKTDLEDFREQLREVFTLYTGGFAPSVMTIEEWEEGMKAERDAEKWLDKKLE